MHSKSLVSQKYPVRSPLSKVNIIAKVGKEVDWAKSKHQLQEAYVRHEQQEVASLMHRSFCAVSFSLALFRPIISHSSINLSTTLLTREWFTRDSWEIGKVYAETNK